MAHSTIDMTAPYSKRVDAALGDKNLKAVLTRSTIRLSGSRVSAMGAIDGEYLRDQTRQMKEYVIRNLPDLLEQFEDSVTKNGGHVHWARDAEEAGRIVLQIARESAARKVVKSKSMATEEIHLNKVLEGSGMTVVETFRSIITIPRLRLRVSLRLFGESVVLFRGFPILTDWWQREIETSLWFVGE